MKCDNLFRTENQNQDILIYIEKSSEEPNIHTTSSYKKVSDKAV